MNVQKKSSRRTPRTQSTTMLPQAGSDAQDYVPDVEADSLKAKYDRLMLEHQEAQKTIELLRASSQAAKDESSRLAGVIHAVETEVKSLQQIKAALESERVGLQKTIKVLQESHDENIKRLMATQGQLSSLCRELLDQVGDITNPDGKGEEGSAHQNLARSREIAVLVTQLENYSSLLAQRDQRISELLQEREHNDAVKTSAETVAVQLPKRRSASLLERLSGTLYNEKKRKRAQIQRDVRTIRESGLFDPVWYLTEYPDVAKAEMDPLEHYVKFGAREYRKPRGDFDPIAYEQRHPEVKETGENPLIHSIKADKFKAVKS